MSIRVHRRLQRLESDARRRPPNTLRDRISAAALQTLSTPDLLLLMEALEAEGATPPTVEQYAAGERLQSALEAECLRAGFKSFVEFDRQYPREEDHAVARWKGRA